MDPQSTPQLTNDERAFLAQSPEDQQKTLGQLSNHVNQLPEGFKVTDPNSLSEEDFVKLPVEKQNAVIAAMKALPITEDGADFNAPADGFEFNPLKSKFYTQFDLNNQPGHHSQDDSGAKAFWLLSKSAPPVAAAVLGPSQGLAEPAGAAPKIGSALIDMIKNGKGAWDKVPSPLKKLIEVTGGYKIANKLGIVGD